MLQEQIRELTAEKFKEIYSIEKFRNEIAYAHDHLDSNSNFKYKATCSWPVKYIVTNKQIEEAKKELDRKTKEIQEKHKNDLLFVGMGCAYDTDIEIGNHRIRTEFLNSEGLQIFVEFSKSCKLKENGIGSFVCTHSVNRSKEIKLKSSFDRQGEYYNFEGLEQDGGLKYMDYTRQTILELVNRIFNCKFKNIIIDNYNIRCDGIVCESPKE